MRPVLGATLAAVCATIAAAAAAAATSTPSASIHVGGAAGYALRLLPPGVAAEKGALCLDGSPPGYWFRPALSGNNDNAKRWRIHLRGGGWCFDVESCASRANSSLGSSTYWTQAPTADDGVQGFMSNDTSLLPNEFAAWNTAFVLYCDGGSYVSNRDDPVTTAGGQQLYFRGRRILDALLDDMDTRAGLLTTAEAVVLTGTSAGGLGTYLNADHVRSRLAPSTALHALPDAGFFLDHANFHGSMAFRAEMQGGLALWNSTLHPACVAATAAADRWQCLFAQYVWPFIETPVFVMNSLYDTAQLGLILQLGCTPSPPVGAADPSVAKLPVRLVPHDSSMAAGYGSPMDSHSDTLSGGACSAAQLAAFYQYRKDFQAVLSEVVAGGKAMSARAGLFATACLQHEETCRDKDWYGITIGGDTAADAFAAWYDANGGHVPRAVGAAGRGADWDTPAAGEAQNYTWIDGVWPHNPSCWVGGHHGGC